MKRAKRITKKDRKRARANRSFEESFGKETLREMFDEKTFGHYNGEGGRVFVGKEELEEFLGKELFDELYSKDALEAFFGRQMPVFRFGKEALDALLIEKQKRARDEETLNAIEAPNDQT